MSALALKVYKVDLRQYEGEEFDRLYGLLDGWSWTIAFYPATPKVYQVTWDEKQSITKITGIPKCNIQEVPGT